MARSCHVSLDFRPEIPAKATIAPGRSWERVACRYQRNTYAQTGEGQDCERQTSTTSTSASNHSRCAPADTCAAANPQ